MPAFAKRQYEVIAAVFKAEQPGANWDPNKHVTHNQLLAALVKAFKADNPGFKPTLFVKAAGGYVGASAANIPDELK